MSLTSPILNMFGRSPLKPLQTHMATVFACARCLRPFYEAVMSGQWEQAAKHRDQIAELENDADNLKRDLRLHLPKGLFLPVARGDILEVLTTQDQIANRARDIAGLVIGRKMEIPPPVAESFIKFYERCVDAAAQANNAINELDQLLESGFHGNEVKLVEEMIVELDRIEHDTDELQIEVRTKLYEVENDFSPIDVMFLYRIIEWNGDIADRAQSVGGLLQLLLAR